MNNLTAQAPTIAALLLEGMSMRATARLAGVSINTVSAHLERIGRASSSFHDRVVRGVRAERIECDEIWSFIYAKHKNTRLSSPPKWWGDTWTWTAIDPDTKFIVSWAVGDRGVGTATRFMEDLRSRVRGRIQLTTDGHHAYLDAVDAAFAGDVDFARLIKVTPAEGDPSSHIEVVCGRPRRELISTSLIERHNLTLRTEMRRYTRRTSGHSKRLASHRWALAAYLVHYNFCCVHSSLGTTPAMAAGLATRVWSTEWLVGDLPRVYCNDGSQRPLFPN